MNAFLLVRVLMLLACAAMPVALWADEYTVVSVFSQTANGYRREKLPDGSFKRQYYALSNGGALGGTVRDHEIDRVAFPDLAGVLAQQLAKKNYFLAQTKEQAELLLVVYWGTTMPFNDGAYTHAVNTAASPLNTLQRLTNDGPPAPQAGLNIAASEGMMEQQIAREAYDGAAFELNFYNRLRERGNEQTARLLGYVGEVNYTNDVARFAGGGDTYNSLIADLEESRYYIVIKAYDFKEVLNQNKKELWVTRMSIATHGTRFEKEFAAMLLTAAPVLGQNSDRLIRKPLREAHVEIGEATVIGTVGPADMPGSEKRSP